MSEGRGRVGKGMRRVKGGNETVCSVRRGREGGEGGVRELRTGRTAVVDNAAISSSGDVAEAVLWAVGESGVVARFQRGVSVRTQVPLVQGDLASSDLI